MQRFSKISVITLVVCLIALAGLAIAAGLGYFSGGTRAPQSDSSAMLRYVPADSPLVFVGRNTPEAAQQANLWFDRVDPKELEPLFAFLNDSADGSAAPLLSWLLEDVLNTVAEGGYDALAARYGSDPEAAYAIYLHGAMPVFRVGLRDQEALIRVLDQAAEETGVSHRTESLAGAELRAWTLMVKEAGDNAQTLELGVVIADNTLTLSLTSSLDADGARSQRFARQETAANLAEAGNLTKWEKHFARNDLLLGYLDIHRSVEALLLPEQNSTGRELQNLLPDFMASVADKLTPACRRDYTALAAGMPRNVMGTTSYRVSKKEVITGLRSILMIENAEISEQLQRLPGFLPAYSSRSDDKLFAYAAGINVDELVPVLTELWTRFIGASFECEQLQQAQQQVNSYNPMMLSIGTAMARGVKGAGIALYDVEADPTSPSGMGGAALISISADNPSALASLMTSYVPGMAGTLLPADGTPVAIPSPFLPEGVYAAIKGKHLVVYKGEQAETAANSLAKEALEINGTGALSLNLRRAADKFIESPESLGSMSAGNCEISYMMLLALSDAPFELSYRETINKMGWDGEVELAMNLPAELGPNIPGTYNLSYLDGDDCTWQASGVEQINADGTGNFASHDEALGCSTFESEYQWTRQGSRLKQVTSAQRERDFCEEGWEELEPDDFTCTILAASKSGFYCIWEEDGDTEIYQFSRQ